MTAVGVVGIQSPTANDPARLTKHAVLPPISSPPPDGGSGSARLSESEERPSGNPFVLPPTGEVFTLREKERQQSKKNRARERKLKVLCLCAIMHTLEDLVFRKSDLH